MFTSFGVLIVAAELFFDRFFERNQRTLPKKSLTIIETHSSKATCLPVFPCAPLGFLQLAGLLLRTMSPHCWEMMGMMTLKVGHQGFHSADIAQPT